MEWKFQLQKILESKKLILIITVVLLLGVWSLESVVKKDITIVDEDKKILITTLSNNVNDALRKAEITLNEYDKLNVDKNSKLVDGMTIEIKRAYPVKIKVDDKDMEVLTAFNRVEDIINQYNIELGEDDRTYPELDEDIDINDTIRVIRVKQEIVKEEADIPYQSIIKYNDELESDKTKKVSEGKDGKKEVEYRLTYENGEEVSKEVLNETIIKEPVDEIVEKGTVKYLVASRGQVIRYKKAIVMNATAYDLSYASTGKRPGDRGYGITRSGTRARPGVVAVDPRVIPLGTKLYIESLGSWPDYGIASAEDTGGAVKGNIVDLFMESPTDVSRFGRRKVKVYILE